MELTDQEWLRELAKQFDAAHRERGEIRITDELAKMIAERMREIADRLNPESEQS